MKVIYLDQPICDIQRAELLFSGHLLVYTQRQSMIHLIEFTENLLKTKLNNLDPVNAQNTLRKEPFLKATCEVQAEFRRSEKARQLFFNVLAECGVDLQTCYYDHFPLRIVPFAEQHSGAHRAAIGHHRDTWGSNIHSQQNWWAPIFSLTKERTIALYPDYWNKALANSTATWCFKEFLTERNKSQKERNINYPSAPIPVEEVDEGNVMKLVIKPGDVLNFSSAHLHASVPNTSDATRYSVEMRTINSVDLNEKKQAPNLDNAGEKPMYSWFKNIKTNKRLIS